MDSRKLKEILQSQLIKENKEDNLQVIYLIRDYLQEADRKIVNALDSLKDIKNKKKNEIVQCLVDARTKLGSASFNLQYQNATVTNKEK